MSKLLSFMGLQQLAAMMMKGARFHYPSLFHYIAGAGLSLSIAVRGQLV